MASLARIKKDRMAQNSGMKNRVGVYDPEGIRTREERETYLNKFAGKEERNESTENGNGAGK